MELRLFYLFSLTFRTLPLARSLPVSNIFSGKVSLCSVPPSECGNFYKAIWSIYNLLIHTHFYEYTIGQATKRKDIYRFSLMQT